MSLPPVVNWKYNYQPSADSPEAELYDYYLKPRDWVNE
jgi:coproporphyrinogen III oxidase